MTTRDDVELTYAELMLEPSDTKEWSLAQDLLSDAPVGTTHDTFQMVDPLTLKRLFFTEDWVYILVDRIASKISAQWLRVMHEEAVDGKKVVTPAENHPLQTILENPNPEQDYHTWMYSLIVDECLMGNAMVWRAAQADQLILLPSEATRLDLASDGTLRAYMLSVGHDVGRFAQKILRFAQEEVCHIRRPNPSSRLVGLSPFVAGLRAVAFNKFTGEYLNNFYKKGAQPGLVLEMADVANEKQALRLLRSFENAYTGRANQRKTMILPKGVSAQAVAHSLADQQLIEYVRSNRETIINLLQVPKHELSIAEAGSLGSEEYKIALKNFWSGQLRSIMRRVAGSLTRFFQDQLGDGYFLEYDLTDVDVLQDDADKKATLAEKLLATHTLNEVRTKLYDLDPVPQGDTVRGAVQPGFPTFDFPRLPAADTTLGLITDVEKGLLSRADAEAKLIQEMGLAPELAARLLGPVPLSRSEMNAKNQERFALAQKALGGWFAETDDRLQQAYVPTYEKMLRRALRLLAAQIDRAVGLLIGGEKSLRTKEDQIDPKDFRRRLDNALDELETQYLTGYVDDLTAEMDAGYDTALAIQFNKQDQERLDVLRQRYSKTRRLLLEERGLTGFVRMKETTSDAIMDVIEQGVRDKLSIADIARRIAGTSGPADEPINQIANIERRAMVIARTETLHAASVGQAAAMADAAKVVGKIYKMWVNAGDERVRGNPAGLYPESKYDHWELQTGKAIPYNKPFRNGLMYPRDPRGDAGDVIQCRCRLVAFAAEDAAAMGIELDESGDT